MRRTSFLLKGLCACVATIATLSPGVVHAQGIDPDMPGFMQDRLAKPEYLRLRDEYTNLLRGLPYELPYNPRTAAITQRERQVAHSLAKVSATAWVPIGPSPIPNGQTEGTTTAVSGRVTCVAIHPTNPDIVYVGTAQGGVYRTVDGGTNWTPISDAAQSLAIGAIALAPSNPSTLYVGTGESNSSCDSYAGVGLYRIDNADTAPVLSGPIDPPYSGFPGSHAFGGRTISKILVHPTNPAIIFVATAAGIVGLGCDAAFGGSLPPLASRGIWRSTNATAAPGSVAFTKLTVTTAGDLGDGTGNRSIADMVFAPGGADTLICSVLGSNAANDGGIYRTLNALASPPTFTNTLSLGTAGAAFRASLDIYRRGSAVVIYVASGESPTGLCGASGASGALRVSTDCGSSWSNRLAGGGGFCGGQCFYNIGIAVVPGTAVANDTIHIGGNIATASCQRLHAISVDGGANFTNFDAGLHADTHAIVVAPSNTSIVYHGNDGGIYKSTDGGHTWASKNNAAFSATQFQSIAIHPTDANFSIGGTQDNGTNLYTPALAWTRIDFGDGGQSAIDQNATDVANVTMYHTYFNQTNNLIGFARVNSVACASDPNWSFLGNISGGVSPNLHCDGTTDLANGIALTDQVNFYAPLTLGPGNPNTVYFGTDRLYRSTTRGNSMSVVSQTVTGSKVSAIGISRLDDLYRIIGGNNGAIFYTTTGANPMTSLDAVGGGSVIPDRYVARAIFDPNNKNTAYIALGGYMGGTAQSQAHVWKVTNLGTSPAVTGINTGLPDVPVNAFVVDPLNSSNLFAGTDIGVYNSTDGGASWTVYGLDLPVVAVFDMAMHPVTRTLRIATHGRGMWENNGPPLPIQLASFTGTVVSGTGVRLEWTTASELDNFGFEVERATAHTGPWSALANGFVSGHGTTAVPQHYTFTDAEPGTGIVYYRLKQLDLDGSVHFSDGIAVDLLTGVGGGSFPTAFSLQQSYPNPFNPSTTIRYGLPQDADVTLEVFNALGQRVALLVSEKQAAGYHEAHFTAGGLASGAYFYTIRAGDYYATKSLVLLK